MFKNIILYMVLVLAFPTMYHPAKTEVQHQKLIGSYSRVVPITGKLERERDALYGVAVSKDKLKKVRIGITLTFNKHNDGKPQIF